MYDGFPWQVVGLILIWCAFYGIGRMLKDLFGKHRE